MSISRWKSFFSERSSKQLHIDWLVSKIMKISEVRLKGFQTFGVEFVLHVDHGSNNANVAFMGSREMKLKLFKVLSLALSFSNEPDPFFDEELIAHGSGTVRIQFVLDETDNESELTLGAQQFTLERTITRAKILNKLDENVIERVQIVHFLEMLEFSRSHPYTFHIRADDIERLTRSGRTVAVHRGEILRKLVGYEDFMRSKTTAQRILNETDDEIHKIESLLRKINSQFNIFMVNEAPVANSMILLRKQSLEQCRRTNRAAAIRESITRVTAEIDRLNAAGVQREKNDMRATEIRARKTQLDQSIANDRTKQRDLLASIRERQRIRDIVSDRVTTCRSRLQTNELMVSFSEKEKSEVAQALNEKELEFKVLTVDYIRLTERSSESFQRMVPLEQSRQKLILNAAQNVRMNWKFTTESERNRWIDAELQSLAVEIKRKESHVKRCNTEFETKQRAFAEKKIELKALNAKHEECYGLLQIEDLERKLQELIRKRNQAQEDEQITLKQIDEQNARNRETGAKHQAIESELRQIIGQPSFDGLESMGAILCSEKCSTQLARGYHGLLIDHLKTKNRMDDPAVGVLAGPILFQHIVDDATTATKFMRLFNENDLPGEIFFVIKDTIQSAGGIENYLSAVMEPPPDPFYGEDHQSFISCIPSFLERMRLSELRAVHHHELRTLRYKLDNLNQSILSIQQEVQASTEACEHFNQAMQEINLISTALDDLEMKMKSKAVRKVKAANELNALLERKLQLETERGLPLLMPDEQAAVDKVRREIDAADVIYRKNKNATNKVRDKRNALQDFMGTYLKRRQRDLDEISLSYATQSELLERDSSELNDTIASLDDDEAELAALNERLKQQSITLKNLANEAEQLRKQKRNMIAQATANLMEKSRLETERNQLNAELAKLHAASSVEIDDDIATLTTSEIDQELDEIKHQLSVFSETNRFDVNRVANFKIEKQHLSRRLKELKKSGSDLRRVITEKSDENENATREMLDQLQANFSSLFQRIIGVAGSSARLQLLSAEAASEVNEQLQLEIFCTFPNDECAGNESPFDGLSPAHKDIVALIFILAVLQTSPYAVYLLDHIDEGIDDVYRRSIADYIDERSAVSQFFVAASHSELLYTPANRYEFISPTTEEQANIIRRLSNDCNGVVEQSPLVQESKPNLLR